MKTWIAFFIVECKRTWKTLLKSIGSFCACLLLTAVLVAAFSAIMQNAQVFQKVNIGIAIPEGESISRLATQYISSMDSVRSVCDFYYMDEQEAVEQLKQGILQAVVVLPEGFYHDVQVGINPPAQIYFPKDVAQNTQVFEELVTAGVSFLQTAEAGVYAALDTASYYGIELQGAGLGDTIAYLFVNQMLKRDSVYSAKMLSSMGNLSVAEYYYAAGLVILLMMCGIQFGFLYGKRNRSVEDKLKIRGVGSIRQSVVKILVMTEFLYVTGLLYYFAGIGIAGWTKTYFVFFQGTTWYALMLLCLGIAIYFQVLYELSGSSSQAAVFVFAVNVITIIGAGVLIPEAYLGKEIAGISRFLPMKYWNVYAAGMLEGEISKDSVAGTVFFLFVGMVAGMLLSWRNEKSGQRSHNDIRSCMHAHTGICENIKKVPMGFVYYKLQLKLWLKHRICWLQILFLVLLLLVIGGIHIPDTKNSSIGLVGVTSGITQTIADRLMQKSDVYEFVAYETSEELEQAVEAGELECGFVFDKEFAKQYEEGSFTDSITYVYTPFTTKGMAVRETVYGTVLELYGEKLLQQNQETIVGQSSEEASTMLAERYEYYLNSDAIFHTEVIYVETDAGMGSDLRRAEPGSDGQNGDADWLEIGKPNLIRGVISCMIFLAVYLSGASCKEEKNQHFLSILEKGKRHSYECAGMLAAVTPMMLVGTGLSCLTILQSEMLDAASGAGFVTATGIGMVIVTEILQMLLLIVVSILFTACTMCIWKKDMGMLSALPVLILLQIIICPVIFDMAVYVPAVKYIRYLCPIAYYL